MRNPSWSLSSWSDSFWLLMLNNCSDNFIVGRFLQHHRWSFHRFHNWCLQPLRVQWYFHCKWTTLPFTFHMATQKRYTVFIMLLVYCCVFLAALVRRKNTYNKRVTTWAQLASSRLLYILELSYLCSYSRERRLQCTASLSSRKRTSRSPKSGK